MPWVESGAPTQIGTVDEIAIGRDQVRIGVSYAETDVAEQWWRLAADPRQSVAVSIGFIPRASKRASAAQHLREFPELAGPLAKAGLGENDSVKVHTEIELLEVSQVSVPANPDAVQLGADRREEPPRPPAGDAPAGPTISRIRNLHKLAKHLAGEAEMLAGCLPGSADKPVRFAARTFIPAGLKGESLGRPLEGSDLWAFAAGCVSRFKAIAPAGLELEPLRCDFSGADGVTADGYGRFTARVLEWVRGACYAALAHAPGESAGPAMLSDLRALSDDLAEALNALAGDAHTTDSDAGGRAISAASLLPEALRGAAGDTPIRRADLERASALAESSLRATAPDLASRDDGLEYIALGDGLATREDFADFAGSVHGWLLDLSLAAADRESPGDGPAGSLGSAVAADSDGELAEALRGLLGRLDGRGSALPALR